MSRVRSVVSSLNASAQRIVSTRSSSIRSLSLYQNKRWASTKAGSNSSTNPFGDDGRCDPHGLYQFELAFLGTGASPSKFRSPSSTLFYFGKLHDDCIAYFNSYSYYCFLADKSWLFDAGDGTMRQTCFGEYSYATLSKIFISRMGPNNLFGLPTMLVYCCSGKGNKDHEPFHIYGPPGKMIELR